MSLTTFHIPTPLINPSVQIGAYSMKRNNNFLISPHISISSIFLRDKVDD